MISREQVLDAASVALAEGGVDAVSLRAIARHLGVVSSAMYRHYPSRDDLLADLARRCDAQLGERVMTTERTVPRESTLDRLAAIVRGTREWARGHPHEYALLFGGGEGHPVTSAHGAAVLALIDEVVADATGRRARPDPGADFETVETWSRLFGHVSFDVFGNYVGIVDDVDAFTDSLIERMAAGLGLPPR